MSSIPQVSPSVASNRQGASSNSKLRGFLPAPEPVPKSRILMVGRNTSWGAPLQSTLKRLGCVFSFAPSLRVTSEYVSKGLYALLILDSTVPPALRKQLVSGLTGSASSIFQLFPVENGCWWLPVLLLGVECFGSPAFRTKDLPGQLTRVLRESAQI